MYEVIGSPKTRAFRVIWMLEELEQPFDLVPAPPRSAEVLALSALGKVPLLRDGDAVLRDSTAILTYLADKHGLLTHAAGTVARARQDACLHFVLDEVDSLLWTAARHSFILPEERRVPQVKESLRWEFARSEQRLDEMLGDGPFLMGETLSVPDIVATHCLGWAISAKFPLESDRLRDYAEAMQGREAYRRAASR
jgi:glutathione S-transferase